MKLTPNSRARIGKSGGRTSCMKWLAKCADPTTATVRTSRFARTPVAIAVIRSSPPPPFYANCPGTAQNCGNGCYARSLNPP